MNTFLITLGFFGVAIILLALGVILSNKPLAGSCGGLGRIRHLLGLPPCPSCGEEDNASSCKRARKEQESIEV